MVNVMRCSFMSYPSWIASTAQPDGKARRKTRSAPRTTAHHCPMLTVAMTGRAKEFMIRNVSFQMSESSVLLVPALFAVVRRLKKGATIHCVSLENEGRRSAFAVLSNRQNRMGRKSSRTFKGRTDFVLRQTRTFSKSSR
jgi:hypothetical protein